MERIYSYALPKFFNKLTNIRIRRNSSKPANWQKVLVLLNWECNTIVKTND